MQNLRNTSDCIKLYTADVSPEGKYYANVSYNTGEDCAKARAVLHAVCCTVVPLLLLICSPLLCLSAHQPCGSAGTCLASMAGQKSPDIYQSFMAAFAANSGKTLQANSGTWLWPLYYNLWGRLSFGVLTNAPQDYTQLAEGVCVHPAFRPTLVIRLKANTFHHS